MYKVGCMWNLGVEIEIQSFGDLSEEIKEFLEKYNFQFGNLNVSKEQKRQDRY